MRCPLYLPTKLATNASADSPHGQNPLKQIGNSEVSSRRTKAIHKAKGFFIECRIYRMQGRFDEPENMRFADPTNSASNGLQNLKLILHNAYYG